MKEQWIWLPKLCQTLRKMQTLETWYSLDLESKPLPKCPEWKPLKVSPVKLIISANSFTVQKIQPNTNTAAHMPFLVGVLRVQSEKDPSKLPEFF